MTQGMFIARILAILREMQHLMKQNRVEARIVEGELRKIALHQFDPLGR